MTSPISSNAQNLWAITSYFNPKCYRRRLANFRIFRAHLNVPLVAVELAYDSDFELQVQDADILIRLRGGAVLWQKERLLNLALQSLPKHCRKVAWLDSDILFETGDWSEQANRLLERFTMVQLFTRVFYLSPNWTPLGPQGDVEFTRPSAAISIASGMSAAACLAHSANGRKGTSAPGLAWAARRGLVDAGEVCAPVVDGAKERLP
jgi:hypothetical protein